MIKRDNKGFTLVELLATIAILGILGTVAVTGTVRYLNSSRDKSYVMMSQALYEAGQNCVIQNKCSKDTTVKSDYLKDNNFIDDLKNPISGNKDCEGEVDIPSDPISGDYVVSLTCEGRKNTLKIAWPDKEIYNIDPEDTEEETEETNEYIVNAYDYNKTTCPTGDETGCNENKCYENTSANSCKTNTIIKYKVNDSDVKKFYVIRDEGSTLTMISKDFVGTKYNNDYTYNDSSDGPTEASEKINNMASNWANISNHTYTRSTLSYTHDNGDFMIEGIWDGSTDNAKARLLTGKEAYDLGCSTSCPAYISTWIGDFTYIPYEICYMPGSYGNCLSWKKFEKNGSPIYANNSEFVDYDSTTNLYAQAVVQINKNKE